MQLNLPDDLAITEEQARLDFAVGLYSSHTLSLARAARLAGRSAWIFSVCLQSEGSRLPTESRILTRISRRSGNWAML